MFNKEEYHKAVIKQAKEVYGEASPSACFNAARDLGMVTSTDSIDDALDYWRYMLTLAGAAFTHEWGYSFEEAERRVSEPGCPTRKDACGGHTSLRTKAGYLGKPTYGSYLDLERTKTALSELEALKAKGVDWKSKLYPQHHTLYHLGEMAKYLL